MDSLVGMDKFLEKHNLSKLNQEEIESMSRTITSMKFEIIIKKTFQQKPMTRQMASHMNSTKSLEKR